MKKGILISALFFCLNNLLSFAQGNQEVAMADAMHQNGKIYVVVGVLLAIFIGLALFLLSIERRVNRLEKEFDA